MNFKIAVHTDIGIKRNINQDSVLIKTVQTDWGTVLMAAVCDGMGGLEKGELASATFVRMLSAWFEEKFPAVLYGGFHRQLLEKSWSELFVQVNAKIHSYSHLQGIQMGTTAAILLLIGQNYYIGNVGDTRIYQIGQTIQQLTKDQTLIQTEVDQGRISYEEAGKDSRRNVLLQCIGASKVVVPEYRAGTVSKGSSFLLCSDGFRHVITKEELYQSLNPEKILEEQKMKEQLIFLTELNKKRLETDNITAVLIYAD